VYPLSHSGYFGQEGHSRKVRVIVATNPAAAALSFWQKLSRGGFVTSLPNGKGHLSRFADGSWATYRPVTSTPNSPAIQVIVASSNGRIAERQKIHFVKGEIQQ
jgi:hypothetical protein